MWRWILLICALVPALTNAQFEFFNCSQVVFCNDLRNQTLEDDIKFSAKVGETNVDDNNVVTIPLSNKKGQKLNLKIALLEGGRARVIVEEEEPKRFELGTLVIEKQPNIIPVNTHYEGYSITIVPQDENNRPYKVVVTTGPPFAVSFYQNNVLDVVLDADKLLMLNNDREWYTFNLQFAGAQRLYGLSYHAEGLVLRDNRKNNIDPYRMKNNDAWGHKAYTPKSLYGSIPVIYGHTANRTYGVFLHNAAEQWIDISYDDDKASAYFMVERAALDLYILFGPTPKTVVRQLVDLLGKAHLPQLWTLGYHQCRFSYQSQEDVMNVVANMDRYDFTFDAIWLDGDHANYSKWFQWNETTYTDPVALLNNVSATGRVCVSISDPHIKVDDEYPVYAGAKGKYFIRFENGSDYEDECWPGLSGWLDYLNPAARDYYSSWFAFDKFNGSTPTLAGIWNDMNEPAVFNEDLEKTVAVNSVHHGNVKHGSIHNIYGFLQTMATHKGLMIRDEGKKRPFILTRSHFAGSQRYAAMWTGDNTASWEHLAITYPQCMTSNMGGMVFCGADIGGFIGDPSDELLQRWYQAAVWTPFFRGHSSREAKRREPYLNENIRDSLRSTIRFRYKHIATFYTAFYEYTRTGDPIIRPLFYNYPKILDCDNQLLLGDNIMAVAVTKPGLTKLNVQIPGDDNAVWYRIDNDEWSVHKSGISSVNLTIETSPVFYRGGSIVVRQDAAVKHTGDLKNMPYTIYINLDAEDNAEGRFYKDDYVSFDYKDKGSYYYGSITYLSETHAIEIKRIDGNGSDFIPKLEEVVIHRPKEGSENGVIESTGTRHVKTRDGQNLIDLDIAKGLRMSKDDSYIIPL